MPLLLGLGVSLGLFALFVSRRPGAFRIERSRTIAAPPAAVFALIQDFHEWPKWSPWENMDPNMTRTYDGPASGKGAHYHWVGNKNVGEGSMTITDAAPDARVDLELRFIKPFPVTNRTIFTLEPEGEGTRVTWAMEGERSFMMKAFDLVMNMDRMVGRDFEKGLDAMGTAAAAR